MPKANRQNKKCTFCKKPFGSATRHKILTGTYEEPYDGSPRGKFKLSPKDTGIFKYQWNKRGGVSGTVIKRKYTEICGKCKSNVTNGKTARYDEFRKTLNLKPTGSVQSLFRKPQNYAVGYFEETSKRKIKAAEKARKRRLKGSVYCGLNKKGNWINTHNQLVAKIKKQAIIDAEVNRAIALDEALEFAIRQLYVKDVLDWLDD